MQSRLPSWIAFMALGIVGVLSGCSPKIGDACATSTDCSVNGDRLCDTTQPGGYCTIFNCEPDTCPDEAVCVAFDEHLDPRCVDDDRWSRFERTYCMLRCESDSDCRNGYVCMDTRDEDDDLGAKVVDHSPDGYKICVVPYSEERSEGATDVCHPYDGGFPDVAPPPRPDAGDASPVDAGAPDVDAATDAPSDVPSSEAGDMDGAPDGSGDGAPDASDASATDAASDVFQDVSSDGATQDAPDDVESGADSSDQ